MESQSVRFPRRVHTGLGTSNQPKRLDAVARDDDIYLSFFSIFARALEVRQIEFRSGTLTINISRRRALLLKQRTAALAGARVAPCTGRRAARRPMTRRAAHAFPTKMADEAADRPSRI